MFRNRASSSNIVTLRLVLIYVFEEIFEGLNLTRESKGTIVIISEFLLSLLEQYFENWVAKVAGGDDEPSKLRPYIHCEISFWNIRCWLRAVASILVGIAMHFFCLNFVDWSRLTPAMAVVSLWIVGIWSGPKCRSLPFLKHPFESNDLPDSRRLVAMIHCWLFEGGCEKKPMIIWINSLLKRKLGFHIHDVKNMITKKKFP